MRIGPKKKKNTHKNVARLVESENWSKKKKKKKTRTQKSVARLVDSENWSDLFIKKHKKTTTRAPKKCC